MVTVFREVRRVMKEDGTCWLNLGDSYGTAGNRNGLNGSTLGGSKTHGRGCDVERPCREQVTGLKSKDLCGVPWRVAFALQADGWYLRSDVIWSKPNPMPESVTDRPTKAHEYIFLLAKRPTYYYDADAVREPHADASIERAASGFETAATKYDKVRPMMAVGNMRNGSNPLHPNGRNARTVWTIATQPYPEAHFATFPEAIPERCIKAGSRVGDLVLDPFTGSGTTGAVALRLGRAFVGVELNPVYAELARTRIGGAAPLFTSEQTA
jgi:DNA modification methylase